MTVPPVPRDNQQQPGPKDIGASKERLTRLAEVHSRLLTYLASP